MMCDGYVTPRRTSCSSPAGFGVPNTFCGHSNQTQGLPPVLLYVTPSGFNGNMEKRSETGAPARLCRLP